MKKILILALVLVSYLANSQTDSRTALKVYFETGKKPTQAQFGKLIDGSANLNDKNTFINVANFNDTIVLKSGDSLWYLASSGDTLFINNDTLLTGEADTSNVKTTGNDTIWGNVYHKDVLSDKYIYNAGDILGGDYGWVGNYTSGEKTMITIVGDETSLHNGLYHFTDDEFTTVSSINTHDTLNIIGDSSADSISIYVTTNKTIIDNDNPIKFTNDSAYSPTTGTLWSNIPITKKVFITADSLQVMFTRPQTILDSLTGGTKYYDIISISARLEYVSTTYACASDELLVTINGVNYSYFTNELIEATNDYFQTAQLKMPNIIAPNYPIKITTTTQNPTTGDSGISFYITYIIKTL